MLKNKRAIKKTLPAFCMLLFILISLAVVSGEKAEAKYEKSANISQSGGWYVAHTGSQYETSNYFLNIIHKADMTEGDLIVNINNTLKFSYTPEAFFNATGGSWDTPYGIWVAKWPWKETGILYNEMVISLLTNNMEEKMEARQDIENYLKNCSSGSGPFDCSNYWSYTTFYNKLPTTEIISSDSGIVECLGMNCVAKKSGVVKLTVRIDPVEVQPIVFYRSTAGWVLKNPQIITLTYPSVGEANALNWDITVLPSEPVAPPVVTPTAPPVLIPSSGACGGDVDGKTFCQTPSRSKLCSAGSTASVVTLVDGKWTWSCKGSDNVPVPCSAVKNCAWTEVNP